MASEEQYEVFNDYFSEEAIESLFDNLPQETLDEMLQVILLVDKKIDMYRKKIKELEK